ncbi:MAG: hypothetical protein E7110_05590 [Bacteroidales bacterium]|nr:hypothetical protein [Bacteroidales bacterium]MBE6246855.1 hypothetical protein [Bacteroidales bacterium]
MQLKANYHEINSFISKKINQPIHLEYGYNGKINITYTYKTSLFLIGEVKKDISISLSIYNVSGNNIVLKADSSTLVNTFLPTILNSIADMKNLAFISANNNKITLSLSDIPELSLVHKLLNLNQINILSDGIEINANIKIEY